MRRLLWVALSALFVSSTTAAHAAPAPKLVIVISVDQFAASVYNRYRSTFSGGLKRMSGGIAFPTGYESHAATETCPGHSTLLTGDHPSHTGIVANNWIDRTTATSLYCVSVAGTGDAMARGPQKLKVTTLGEWLKRAHPQSRVVSISGKDRAAIMMAGHHPDLVAWWMDGFVNNKPVFGFQTSAYAGPAGPRIRKILKNEDDAIAARWRASPPQLWAQTPADCVPLQRPHRFGDAEVSGVVPPALAEGVTAHPGFMTRTQFADALHASPMYDTLTLDFATRMAKQWRLGRSRTPDLLTISLSATDYIGHRFGNGGAEMCAQVHALDSSLGRFFANMDRLRVPYMVVLSADHGSVDAPERLRETGIDAQRVDSAKFLAGLNAHLKQVLNVDWDPISGEDIQQLYMLSPGDPRFLARVRAEALDWIRHQPSVENAFTRDEVAAAVPAEGKSPADLTIPERLHESYDPDRSADIFVQFRKYVTLGWPRGPGDYVAGHGSPWDYDRQVPILFWWPGIASRSLPDAVETVDIAPTLAGILGLTPPAVDGHCLQQVSACIVSPPPQTGERGR